MPFAHLEATALENYEPDILFDTIVIMGVLEHFEDIPATLKKIRSLLTLTGLPANDGFVYVESPNCLAYSEDKTEGFRQTFNGSGQTEWHLARTSWEKMILDAEFTILRSIIGSNPFVEFIWVLK